MSDFRPSPHPSPGVPGEGTGPNPAPASSPRRPPALRAAVRRGADVVAAGGGKTPQTTCVPVPFPHKLCASPFHFWLYGRPRGLHYQNFHHGLSRLTNSLPTSASIFASSP